MEFISLGSSSSGNSYLLRDGKDCIILDAGIARRNILKYLQEAGIGVDEVRAVFITHEHIDHIKATPFFANELNIPIYATEFTHCGIAHSRCLGAKLAPANLKVIQKDCPITIGAFRITPFEVPHDSTDCVGYRVENNGVTFCLITDAGDANPYIEENIARANYLVLEANYDEDMLMTGRYPARLKGRIRSGNGHLSNKHTAALLVRCAQSHLQHVWLCHLSQENNTPDIARRTIENELRQNGIEPGVDFQLEILKRKEQSPLYTLT